MAGYKVEICGVNTAALPLLKTEEKELLLKKIKNGDTQARERFINGNLRLVLSIVQRFSQSSENIDDLFQIGCVGMIKAIDNFDISQGVQFSTYAVPMIIGEIKRYLRDSNPVGHSISPVIHNTLADLCGIDMVYTTFKVEKGAVDTAVKGAYALDILGLNVTVPHKQEVIGTLESVDPLAEAIGAVNTLVRTEHGYKGYNTDILGLERELEEEQVELKDSPVILLGAGGAARAIAFLCVSKGAKEVAILNRTEEKAAVIAEDVNRHLQSKAAYAMKLSDYGKLTGENYVVIQTTSVGLYPNCDDAVIEDEDFYKRAAVGVDIIYNPAETKFMKLMKAQGKPAYNGLKMLLYQGVSAFELWNDIKISKENIRKVYENMQKKLG